MTKQVAIERARAMLEVLEALPDSVDIITAEVTTYNIPHCICIHLESGIEAVAAKTGKSIEVHYSEETGLVHREIFSEDETGKVVQLEDGPDKK